MGRRYLVIWWTVGMMAAFGLAAFVVETIPGRNGVVEGVSTGLIVGGVQWALLRGAGERFPLWPMMTAAGWALVGLLVVDWPIWAGPWVGMLQWVALRRAAQPTTPWTNDAGWWVLASAGGWFATWYLTALVQRYVTEGLRVALANAMLGPDAYTSLPFYLVIALNWTLGATAYGLITALMLAAILDPRA